MKNAYAAATKSVIFGLAIVVFLILNQKDARADTVVIHGLTVGSYNGSIFLAPSASLLGLTFNGTTFPNPIAIADTSAPSFSFNSLNLSLGSFTLTGDPATYNGNTFSLRLTYSFVNAPLLDIEPISTPQFASSLVGTIQPGQNGSLFIDFNNAPLIYTVTLGGIEISRFSVAVADVTIQPGQTVNIAGTITQISDVPEPATLLLLVTGLAGVGGVVRKRWKHNG